MIQLKKLKNVGLRGDTQLVQRASIIIAIVVFALGTLASAVYSNSYRMEQESELSKRESQQIIALNGFIQSRVASYRQALRGAAGMINVYGRENLTQTQWNQYVETLRAGNRFTELLGIGMSDVVSRQQLSSYQVTEGIQVYPTGDRQLYSVIRYLFPQNEANQKALGFDMYSESTRRQAMDAALETNLATLSAPLISVQDSTVDQNTAQKSVLMYFPFYQNGEISPPLAERKQKLVGYTYLVFRPHDVMEQQDTVGEDNNIEYKIEDLADRKNPIGLYTSKNFNPNAGKIVTQDLGVNGRTWRLSLHTQQSGQPLGYIVLFFAGLIASAGIAVLIYMLLINRSKRVQEEYETEIQKTKDDLLALASHQLRTPATGVRQYLSMLEGGYFGPLTEDQASIAKKAFIANERQLEIIDQLLYVAKADAGQIHLIIDSVDLLKTLQDVVDVYRHQASAKGIEVVVRGPKKAVIDGDERFITMILENLISNAIKYSNPHTKIMATIAFKGMTAQVSVKDNGVGIDESNLADLFQKFQRIQNPLSRQEGGSGLGLFLAQKLALSHGGSISVKSAVGVGSTFTLSIPTRIKNKDNVVQLTD